MNTVPTVSDTKQAFYRAFPRPITPIYRRSIDELLVETHLLTVNQDFKYDMIFASGWINTFVQFTYRYQPERDRSQIFIALAHALRLDPDQLNKDSEQLEELATKHPEAVVKLLTTLETDVDLEPLTSCVQSIASNPKFKYSRIFAVGLFTLLETCTPDYKDPEKRQQLLTTIGGKLGIPAEKLIRDHDLYQSSLEKLKQSLQMMDDLVEAERKKREKSANLVSNLPSTGA